MPQPPAPTPGPQASDPTVLPGGQVLPRQSPTPLPSSGAFRVDLERAPRAIADLEQALVDLQDLKNEAMRLGKVTPSASDSVSVDAATVLGATAVGGPGSLLEALDAGLTHVQGLIDSMRADMTAYRTSESAALRAFDAR